MDRAPEFILGLALSRRAELVAAGILPASAPGFQPRRLTKPGFERQGAALTDRQNARRHRAQICLE